MLNALDLFSGIGGNTVALCGYCRTVAYCESDRHAQSVLLSRMQAGDLPTVPICTDVRELDGRPWRGRVDIIVAGFPCQDISVAGKGAGITGERSGLFFEVVRLAEEVEPAFLFLENVPAIRTRGLDRVVEEFTALGYDMRWTMLSASDVGAHHKRERWFMLAFHPERTQGNTLANSQGVGRREGEPKPEVWPGRDDFAGSSPDVADADSSRLEIREDGGKARTHERPAFGDRSWEPEPPLDRVVVGLPQRVDRIKRLGNSVVPKQARAAFEYLIGIAQVRDL